MNEPGSNHRFQAWLRGELDPVEERAFLAAAETDPELRDEVAAYRGLIAELRALPVESQPERDLWPALALSVSSSAGASARRRAPRWRVGTLALAASLLAVIGVALLRRAQPPVTPAAPPPAAAAIPVSAVAGSAFAQTDQALAAIRQELRREVESVQEQLPPETRQLVFDNLDTIERAIAEIEAALALRPANPELARTYIAYRQRQIALLRQVNLAAARL